MTTATYTDALARYLDFGKRPSPMDLALMVVGSIGGAFGLAFVFYMLITEGHAAFNTSSDMAWGRQSLSTCSSC